MYSLLKQQSSFVVDSTCFKTKGSLSGEKIEEIRISQHL